ncbi:SufS family cysteine desulfurase [Candidatus Roizmanbacteria bacterium]|nr:SufS family cysteine desulfurase [Candidatus Roizmanbacteria bacterium]
MRNFKSFKEDFPIFKNVINFTYLDSTATSLKPQTVISKLVEYYSKYSANIFRGVYKISEEATKEYEETRTVVADFINAKTENEIIFTRNATESLNLIAYSLGREILEKGDEIITTVMEHHSNFVPWQQLAFENGAVLKVINIDDDGYLDVRLEKVITKKTKILALTYVSNVLGTINPIKEITASAKKINPNIIVIVDAAQAVPHMKVDVQDLGGDFLVFSSHKMLGPTGVGVMWGKENLLESMFPFMYGGEMISEVYLDKTVFKGPPHKFEAGTPSIGEVIGFKEAIKYLKTIGMDNVRRHEKYLTLKCIQTLKSRFGKNMTIFGPADIENKGGVIAFNFGKYHPHDIASILDEDGVAVRAGHHCAMPLHNRLGVDATVRASFYIYNDENDIEKLVKGLEKVKKTLG